MWLMILLSVGSSLIQIETVPRRGFYLFVDSVLMLIALPLVKLKILLYKSKKHISGQKQKCSCHLCITPCLHCWNRLYVIQAFLAVVSRKHCSNFFHAITKLTATHNSFLRLYQPPYTQYQRAFCFKWQQKKIFWFPKEPYSGTSILGNVFLRGECVPGSRWTRCTWHNAACYTFAGLGVWQHRPHTESPPPHALLMHRGIYTRPAALEILHRM